MRWFAAVGPTASSKIFELILSQYAPYLGAIVGFQFATQKTAKRAGAKATPFVVAIVMSGLWNLTLLGFVVQACLDTNTTEASISDITAIVPKLSWIVAPAIGFFFGKPAS